MPAVKEWIEAAKKASDAAYDRRGVWQPWWRPVTIPAEIRAALPAQIQMHCAALIPADCKQIMSMLARLAVHFPDQRSKQEWLVLHEDYADALGHIPPDILAEVARRYLTKGRFYPKIVDLLEQADALLKARQFDLHALQELLLVETPEEKMQREAAEAAERERKREADRVAHPFIRIIDKWAGALRPHIYYHRWYPWVEAKVAEHGVEKVDLWHAKLVADLEKNPLGDANAAFMRLLDIAQVDLQACGPGPALR